MNTKTAIWIQLLLFIFDVFLINVIFLGSFALRYGLPLPGYNFRPYKENFLFVTFLYALAFAICGCFRPRYQSRWALFKCVFKGIFVGTLLGVSLVYVNREQWSAFPSSVFLIAFIFGLFVIFPLHLIVLSIADRIRKKVLIIGQGRIEDVLDEKSRTDCKQIEKIEDILHHEDADEIIICKEFHDDAQMNLLIFLLLKLNINVIFSPALYAKLLSESVMEENALRYVATSLGRKSDTEEFLIRALDILLSLVLLLVLSPVMLLIACLVKLSSPGPVIFCQTRLAKDGEPFILYKFRTMVDNAERESGPVLASENDDRVTPIGAFLRQTRLDEMPQLFNVLLGQMSLVGPRPERLHFIRQHRVLREMRLAVKPGLTGFAQIRNLYDLHPRHKIKYDYLYIQKRSLALNLYILLKTLPVIIMRKGR